MAAIRVGTKGVIRLPVPEREGRVRLRRLPLAAEATRVEEVPARTQAPEAMLRLQRRLVFPEPGKLQMLECEQALRIPAWAGSLG